MHEPISSHEVMICPGTDHLLLECVLCGPLGVSVTDEAADIAKAIHETFGGVLADIRVDLP